MKEYIVFSIPFIAYLLGTFPSAYLIVRIFAKTNILEEGSGNAGAMNSYEVTGKREIGIFVFVIDMLKGFLAVMIAREISGNVFWWLGVAAVATALGHNYNIWHGFKGGRGLACLVGALLQINVAAVIVWVLIWLPFYFSFKKEIHAGNIFATLFTPLAVVFIPEHILNRFSITLFDKNDYFFLILALCIVVMLRHIEPIKQMMNKNKILS